MYIYIYLIQYIYIIQTVYSVYTFLIIVINGNYSEKHVPKLPMQGLCTEISPQNIALYGIVPPF